MKERKRRFLRKLYDDTVSTKKALFLSDSGSVLLLVLLFMVVCLAIGLWVAIDVSTDLKSSGAFADFSKYFYAAESAARRQLISISGEGTISRHYRVEFGSELIDVDVTVSYLGCHGQNSSYCQLYSSQGCREYEITARAPYDVIVKFNVLKPLKTGEECS